MNPALDLARRVCLERLRQHISDRGVGGSFPYGSARLYIAVRDLWRFNKGKTKHRPRQIEKPFMVEGWDRGYYKAPKNENAAALGRLGGLKGGKALAAKMTPAERTASAQKAARARWAK